MNMNMVTQMVEHSVKCLVVCLTLLASFFLPSHLSFKHEHVYTWLSHHHLHAFQLESEVVIVTRESVTCLYN